MKRIKTLIAGILSTASNLAWAIMYGYMLITVFAILGGLDSAGVGVVGGILVFTYAIIFLSAFLGLIFSICSLIYFNSSDEVFAKRKKLNTAAVVFNFISAIFLLLTLFGDDITAGTVILVIVAVAAYVAANVLYILDMKNKKAQVIEQEQPKPEQTEEKTTENKEK